MKVSEVLKKANRGEGLTVEEIKELLKDVDLEK